MGAFASRTGSLLLLSIATLALGACSSTRIAEQRYGTDVWVQPSPILLQQIEDEAKRLPWTRGFERLEQIRWFASVGEPAYTRLLQLAEDEREDVAAAALASLGATLDRRLVEHVRELRWRKDRSPDLHLERARALTRLGDWSEIPRLIEGLADDRLYTRALCLDALREATRETHGFDPRDSDEGRAKAVERWQSWWQKRSGDGLLRSS